MKTYKPTAGEDINETAKRMIALAKKTKGPVKAKFNNVTLIAEEDSTVGEVVADFERGLAEAAEAYRNSSEGRRVARESEERKEEVQRKHDALMEELPDLDFTNLEAVLDWLCEFQDPSDHIGVVKRQSEVLRIFAEHGYQPGMKRGRVFNDEDRENSARYIIGRALYGLQSGTIHQVIRRFIGDWNRKFAA